MEHQLAPEIEKAFAGRWEPVYRSQLHFLVTWSTRGRRPVLRERHTRALAEQIRRICDERGYGPCEVAAGSDHAHVLLALKPTQSVASVVRELKGKTGMSLVQDFPELRVWLRGHLLWDERYAVETVSALRVEPVRARLRALHGPEQEGYAEAS